MGDFLAPVDIPHPDQTKESDLHLLTRPAKQYDAIAKPAMDTCCSCPEGKQKLRVHLYDARLTCYLGASHVLVLDPAEGLSV
uniref:Uncharacterized protein n=1 Tax=Candidatus Kentrum eta TaxID=2126337 RepID=A0A450URD5_9GAMM|nr:MAG: hypothetical protein BECKH772A_GA0070896_1000265 [Candidatus Kentron sp. H]VFJ88897.1 MAG: hypothetical protein BECKH772B_GA0070898_1000261 [Candidatus Kentron sp. H]VFJ95133.1 MAG: hypothetical protein BECKH772C_GA0070978_10001112 [Candidatus Kentron sp. H]